MPVIPRAKSRLIAPEIEVLFRLLDLRAKAAQGNSTTQARGSRGVKSAPIRFAVEQSTTEHGEHRCQKSSSSVLGRRESLLQCAPRNWERAPSCSRALNLVAWLPTMDRFQYGHLPTRAG